MGKTGRNFGAGMSGGIAYVYDKNGDFKNKCNIEMVVLEKADVDDELTIRDLLHNHYRYTNSPAAKKMLDGFNDELRKFVKVMPLEYKRILEQRKLEKKLDLAEVSD